MRYQKSPAALFKAGLLSCLSLLTFGLPLQALAVDELNLPDDLGLPGRREGGGTRSPCLLKDQPEIKALVPKSLAGTTASSTPTFLVYVPSNTAQGAEFGIEDENGKQLYQTILKQPIESGVISVTLPSTPEAPKLVAGKNYYWYFQLICDFNTNMGVGSRDDFAEGWVQKVDLNDSVQQQISQTSGRDRLDLYAKEGLWYDLVATLAQLRRQQPQDTPLASTLAADWASILTNERVDLDELTRAPLASCCTANLGSNSVTSQR